MTHYLLKKIKTALLLVICPIIFVACSDENEPEPDPDPDPPLCSDTLATGWQRLNSPFPGLSDVFFTDASNGIIAGTAMAKTTDGGANWTMLTNSTGFINCFITPNGNIFAPRWPEYMMQASLTNSSFNIGTIRASDVYFTDNNNGFAVVDHNFNKRLHITTNGGATWTIIDHHMPVINSNFNYATLHFTSASKGWIGNGRLMYQINNNTFTDSVELNISTAVSNANMISAVQSLSSSVVFAAATSSEIFKSTNGGITFTKIAQLKASAGTTDIHFFSEQLGYASFHNKIYKTTDGGATWQTVVTTCEQDFAEIHFTDQNHGWGCTYTGRIFRFVQ